MTGLDATIARALSGYNAGDVLSFDSLREAANAAQLSQQQVHGQIRRAIAAGYIEVLRLEHNGKWYDAASSTEHPEGLHRRILNYVRTGVPVPRPATASCGAQLCSVDFTHGPHRHEDGYTILELAP